MVIFLRASLCVPELVSLILQQMTLPMLHKSLAEAGQSIDGATNTVFTVPSRTKMTTANCWGSAKGGHYDYEAGDSQFTRSPEELSPSDPSSTLPVCA